MASAQSVPREVWVTGLGVVNAAGTDLATYWAAVLAGQCNVVRLDDSPRGSTLQAPVNDGELELACTALGVRATDRVVRLACVACGHAWADAGLPARAEPAERAGAILGSGLGGIQFQEDQMWRVLRSREDRIHPHTTPRVSSTALLTEVAQQVGLRGPGYVVNSACASGAHAIGQAMQLIRWGGADVMLAGGAEAPLTYFSLLAFRLLGVLAQGEEGAAQACKPFDVRRDGFVLGEGAAALVLEAADHARARGAHAYARVLGYGQSLGAYHPVHARPDGEDAAAAMRGALRDADVDPSWVGYVNAHGTGTRENDVAEARAMALIFGPRQPSLSSIKPVTGHTLGAAGALEAVATVKALETGLLPPNANLGTRDPACPVNVLASPTLFPDHDGSRLALSNSFGFANVNVSLLFERNAHA